MANEYAINVEDLLAVADAIRDKGEKAETLAFPDEFVSAVQKISTGAELNYSVAAYASEDELPQTADENTIAVITDTEITAHVFAAEEPKTPAEGLVWFETGAAGKVYFAATADGSIYLYPSKARQYVSGAWVSKNAKIFQNTTWNSIIIVLFEAGNQYEGITGGWSKEGYFYEDENSAATINKEIICEANSGAAENENGVAGKKKRVKLSEDTTIVIRGSINNYQETSKYVVGISETKGDIKNSDLNVKIIGEGDFEEEINFAESGNYYVYIAAYVASSSDIYESSISINEIYLR